VRETDSNPRLARKGGLLSLATAEEPERSNPASRKAFSLLRGTEGSNPCPSSGESVANRTFSIRCAPAPPGRSMMGTMSTQSPLMGYLESCRSRAEVFVKRWPVDL
jgi:hypothetical protein